MDKIDKARMLFAKLESKKFDANEAARRNFEIHSRLAHPRA
jgi:hypothetical protein